MHFIINTLFPNLYENFLSTSLVKKAVNSGIISFITQNIFDFSKSKKRVDKKTVGHGAGMALDPEVIGRVQNTTIEKFPKVYTIFFSPHGQRLDQDLLKEIFFIIHQNQFDVVLYAGRYEGFDVRAEEEYADKVISIGDYVLCGGDLPVMVFCEALIRLIPGVIGNANSVINDSFYNVFLDCPHYVQPDIWCNRKIPEVLKGGDHKKIAEWREKIAVTRSIQYNWDWTRKHLYNVNNKKKVSQAIPNHYCLLLHNDIMLPSGHIGNSSVTSIDIHDLARSCATYGLKKYYIVTRLEAQQRIVNNFLSFWHDDEAIKLNESRAFALANTILFPEISDVIKDIEEKEGLTPITIVTSSRRYIEHMNMINFSDQGMIWQKNRPVLFIFGTSHGISPALMNMFHYKLVPIEGLCEFNFLSVRAAVAIVLDRWLGIENKIVMGNKVNNS